MTAFLVDLSIIGIVAFCGWRGYKNGLIRGVFGVLSLIVAILVANAAAQAYSKEAKSVVMPFASGIIDSTLTEMEENDITYQAIAHDHEIDTPIFGTSYTVLREIGLPEPAAVLIAEQMNDEEDIALNSQEYVESLADKLTDSLSHVAVFGVAFLVLAIVFAVIGNLFGFVFSLPGLKLVDIISGTAFGLAKGIIIVLTLGVIIRYFGILFVSTLERTSLLSYLVGNNVIANNLGL